MSNVETSARPSVALTGAVLLAVVAAIWFLLPFFGVIVTSLIIAFSFSPVFQWISERVKRKSTAAALTLVATFVTVIIPVLVIVSITVTQARTLSDDMQSLLATNSFDTNPEVLLDTSLVYINNISGGFVELDPVEVKESLANAGSQIASSSARLLGGLVSGISGLVTSFVLFVYIFLGVLTQQKALLGFIKKLNPLGDDVADLYLKRAGAMTNGMVRGQFVIAFAQAVIGALTLWIAGVPYVAFLFLALVFLSIIPLGGGILSIPIGLALLLLGNVWQGLVVLLGHFILVTNVDNVLRPLLIPKEAKLPSALTLLGVFAGLAAFGFLGLIIGPIIMILIVTTLEVYASVQANDVAKKPKTI